jgi:hypothetical protein
LQGGLCWSANAVCITTLVQDTARLVDGVGIAVDAIIASHILGREYLIGKVAIRPLIHRPRWNGGAVHMTTLAPEAAHTVEVLRIAGSVVAAIRVFFALLHVQWWLLIQLPKLSGKFGVETPGVLAICILHW